VYAFPRRGNFSRENVSEKDFVGSITRSINNVVGKRSGTAKLAKRSGTPEHAKHTGNRIQRIDGAAFPASSQQAEKLTSQVDSSPHVEEPRLNATVTLICAPLKLARDFLAS